MGCCCSKGDSGQFGLVTATVTVPTGEGLGVGVVNQNGGNFISGLKPKGNADNCGKLKVEDRFLEVGGIDVSSISREDCIGALKSAAASSTRVIIVVHRAGAGEPPPEVRTSASGVITAMVSVPRGEGVGVGVANRDNANYIRGMKPGGNADKSGQLRAEDRFLKVGGVDVSSASREECIAALKGATSTSTQIEIVVARVGAASTFAAAVALKQEGPKKEKTVITATVTVPTGEGVGIGVVNKGGGNYINGMKAGGNADKCGQLAVEDRFLEVGAATIGGEPFKQIDVSTASREDCIGALKKAYLASTTVIIVVERADDGVYETYAPDTDAAKDTPSADAEGKKIEKKTKKTKKVKELVAATDEGRNGVSSGGWDPSSGGGGGWGGRSGGGGGRTATAQPAATGASKKQKKEPAAAIGKGERSGGKQEAAGGGSGGAGGDGMITATVTVPTGEGLGIAVVNQDGGNYIGGMKPGGNADKSGQLRVEDRFLKVGGVDVSSVSRTDCIAALKAATSTSTQVMIIVERASTIKTTEVVKVTIVVHPGEGLGIALKHENKKNTITSMKPSGNAAKSGKVRPGDRLMKVNDTNIAKASREDCVAAIKRASQTARKIRLVLRRPVDGHAPAPELLAEENALPTYDDTKFDFSTGGSDRYIYEMMNRQLWNPYLRGLQNQSSSL